MAPIARGLADVFRVTEPMQRNSGDEPLTVDAHVADLHELIQSRFCGSRPALVGSSWGAMLALAYAAAHPERTGPIVLVGCGTFDRASRARFRSSVEEKIEPALRRRMAHARASISDPNERLRALAGLLLPVYAVDPITDDLELGEVDARANRETWTDMVRLQEEGRYPASFSAITSAVLMLHGIDDPHPGRMVRASLAPYIPQIEYHEWERCGHYPWMERTVSSDFFRVLRAWLLATCVHAPARRRS
jgi:pimeloyl-ACP methyl ester carboxylesterase